MDSIVLNHVVVGAEPDYAVAQVAGKSWGITDNGIAVVVMDLETSNDVLGSAADHQTGIEAGDLSVRDGDLVDMRKADARCRVWTVDSQDAKPIEIERDAARGNDQTISGARPHIAVERDARSDDLSTMDMGGSRRADEDSAERQQCQRTGDGKSPTAAQFHIDPSLARNPKGYMSVVALAERES